MRKHFNRNAICSSENYEDSRRAHLAMLQERHAHFKEFVVSGEISIDTPIINGGRITPKFKTIKVFGKDMKLTIEEFNTHCKHLNL